MEHHVQAIRQPLPEIDRLLAEALPAKEGNDLLVYRPSWDNIPDPVPAMLTLNDIKLVTAGNLSVFIAGAGAGKSALCEAVCSAGLNPSGDCFGLAVDTTGIIHYTDTERSQYDHARSWLRTMRRAGIEHGTTPDRLNFELISTLPSVESRRAYLESVIETPDLALLILDGLADFVPDVNDAETSNAFLFWLLSEAKRRSFGIITTLHPNPADKERKPRGHLGSEAVRRAESVLCIAKDQESGTRTISMDFRYGKNRNDADTVSAAFQWDEAAGMFLSCNPPAKKPAAAEKYTRIIEQLREIKNQWPFAELIEKAAEIVGKPGQETVGAGIYRRLRERKLIVKDSSGLWLLVANQ